MARKATNGDTRHWVGDVGTADEVEGERRWVVWGNGREPGGGTVEAMPGNDVAEAIARGADPEWWDVDDRWIAMLVGTEGEIDEFVSDNDEARGYAPYLVGGKDEEMPAAYMKGTLRSDVGPRRKVNQPRPV